jgi:NADH-quinone oxidoreductase subunit F
LDIHLSSAQASEAERAAVDSILGAPKSGWAGGALRSELDTRAAFGGRSARSRRHRLLPVLRAIQSRIGWISPGAINYVSVRLDVAPAEIYGVASFYKMFSLAPRPAVVAQVCDDVGCLARGAADLCQELGKKLGPAGSPCDGGRATWLRSPCLGLCERAPAALISAAGESHRERVVAPATTGSVQTSLRAAVDGRLPAGPDEFDPKRSVPQVGGRQLRLLRRIGRMNPASMQDYRRLGGYEALRRAIELGPEGVIREILDSKLLGRGGAAFPTGKKWEAVLKQSGAGSTRYVVCNADESEPGTFKDRVLMEGDPFAVLEGMTIAGLATGSEKGFIYVRGEYPLAAERLGGAIEAARADGYLGGDILGRGLRFEVELRRGAGAYICGEETALFNSIEGYRGEPRNKPPYPTESGLFGHPTVVNNVETLVNIPEIILGGGAAYSRVGTRGSAGYRLFCLSGHVARPGTYEVCFGVTLRNLIDLAGGMGGNGKLQAVLLGGAAGGFLSPRELDTPLTFEGVRAAGAALGSGAVVLFDDSVDLSRILLRIAAFFREESCGQCVPCRVGAVRQEEALERLAAGKPLDSAAAEIQTLREMAQAMRDASICGLGQTAPNALFSAIERWSLFS